MTLIDTYHGIIFDTPKQTLLTLCYLQVGNGFPIYETVRTLRAGGGGPPRGGMRGEGTGGANPAEGTSSGQSCFITTEPFVRNHN